MAFRVLGSSKSLGPERGHPCGSRNGEDMVEIIQKYNEITMK